ncbi:hypothetical protein DCC39_09355 [Pueribacillus theae]|uniref:DUF2140 domain-containing protein n=1 Tax=Pueribacillus theae TaxID=2171751 RepID=A0A2U1K4C7_9BACI|nr:YpmS family protein [Pueribacillus theae]PWA11833.1 hypothetical protein DCC39_09355 [Pueribacillus theae]
MDNIKKWKTAFFSLLVFVAVIIVTLAVLLYLLFSDVETDHQQYIAKNIDGKSIFTVETSKERLNYIIATQLEKLKYNRKNVDFTVVLNEKVNVEGHLNVFDRKLRFQMILEPVVQENGDLLLRQEAFYIGELPVPSKQVLKFMNTSAKIPDWIIIEPNEGIIYVALNQIEVSDDMYVKVRTIDLKKDDISFEIYESVDK